MKKSLFVLVAVLMLFSGCSQQTVPEGVTIPVTEDVTAVENEQIAAADGIDVDLTNLNSTMVFARVNDIMVNPKDYSGQTMKMEGIYESSVDPTNGNTYHFVVITDATGCCPQGMEFILDGDSSAYPEPSSTIQIVGEFEGYLEGELTYYRIRTDEVLAA